MENREFWLGLHEHTEMNRLSTQHEQPCVQMLVLASELCVWVSRALHQHPLELLTNPHNGCAPPQLVPSLFASRFSSRV